MLSKLRSGLRVGFEIFDENDEEYKEIITFGSTKLAFGETIKKDVADIKSGKYDVIYAIDFIEDLKNCSCGWGSYIEKECL
jgi:hypothetical protein